MSNAYEEHLQAVEAAIASNAELQNRVGGLSTDLEPALAGVSAAREQAQETLGAIASAVGDSPRNVSAQSAFGMISDLGNQLEEVRSQIATAQAKAIELAAFCEVVNGHLETYAGQF